METEILKRSATLRAGKKPMTLEGYAALYDEETVVAGQRERIQRGAFDGRLDDDVRLLFNHDNNMPFARTTNGTLKLSVDERGLYYKANVIDTQAGRDLYAMVQRGDVTQSSFAFSISERSYDDGVMVIEKVGQLYDVSPVTYPAYEATSVVARKKVETKQPQQDMRKYTLEDLQALRKQQAQEHEQFVAKLEESNEEISDNDMVVARNMVDELAKLDKKIELKRQEAEAAARLARVSNIGSSSEAREVKKVNNSFSLQRAILNVAEGRNLTGAELEWAQEYSREAAVAGISANGNIGIPGVALRAGAADNFQATGGGDGSGFVATNVGNAIEALRAPSLIQQVGTTVINGATGNLQFPRVSVKAGAGTVTEVASNAASGMEMDTLTLSPQRVSNKTTYSKLLLVQGGPDVDAVIARDLIAGVNEHIDTTSFAHIISNTAATTTADLTASNQAETVFALEQAVANAGADLSNVSLVADTTTAHALLRRASAVASITTLLGEYRYFATPHVNTTDTEIVMFGNFAQACIMAFFGGIDLLVDPYSAAGTGQINIHVNRFYDFDIRQAGAVATHEADTSD
jgi:HK97 family phage prohead protease/HK97 family phage major capsid protein